MKNQLTLQDLENSLNSLTKECNELNGVELEKSDIRCGKRVALCRKTEHSLQTLTDFMTYSEMNQFLRGYSFKAENRF